MRFLHKYMRAIGFSNLKDRNDVRNLINGIVRSASLREFTANDKGVIVAEFSKDYANNMGIAVCGELDEETRFSYDYYFPYLRPTNISSNEEICIERHTALESYVGICDETRVGVSLIFYVQNRIPYINKICREKNPEKNATLSLSGLALQGKIMMPIMKSEKTITRIKKDTQKRNSLIAAARNGDTDAMEALALQDMDIYSYISKNMTKVDVYTMVDTYFMPYGVECDQYSVLGEILECNLVVNSLTEEEVYHLTVECNDLVFDVCINKMDLEGEPAKGRRFKGSIWLQGYLNYDGDPA